MLKSHWELLSLAGIVVLGLLFLLSALAWAREEVRDDLRRQDITNIKRSLEHYNNEFTFYVSPPDQTKGCTSSDDPNSWFFGKASPLLAHKFIDALPHDVREGRGHTYHYCVTELQKGKTIGFYLEAQLEGTHPTGQRFDEDEERKFWYRIVQEDNTTRYRVCGGTEKQCEPS